MKVNFDTAVAWLGAALLLPSLVSANGGRDDPIMAGYDLVAYHSLDPMDDGIPGNPAFQHRHEGYLYYFANQENLDEFKANPKPYLPAYGGYCAFGTAMGFKFDGDPNYWKIVDNKLYLNLSQDIQERWEGDIPGFVEQASANWEDIADKDPAELQQ